MKDKHIIRLFMSCLVFVSILFIATIFYLSDIKESVEDKIDELKPKETKTIEDYHNQIEESKQKIDKISQDKWLKVSDIKDNCTLISDFYRIYVDDWRELLKKAEDAPQILWNEPSYDSATLVDVSIGITAEQMIKALQSIDPNEYIRHKKKKKILKALQH